MYSKFWSLFSFRNVSSEPSPLFFCKMMGVSFEEFFHFFVVVLSLEVSNNLLIANPLHRLKCWRIAFFEEMIYFFYESVFKHFLDPCINEMISSFLISSQSEHQNGMTDCLLNISCSFSNSSFFINF